MKNIYKLIFISALASVFIISCSKDDDEKNNTNGGNNGNRTAQLANTWMITSVVVDSLNIDIWPFNPDECMKDDLYIFNTDGTGAIDQGDKKCDTTASQQDPFSWSWENGEKDLLVILPDSNLSLKDIQFKNNTMSAKTDAVLDIQSTVTFTKQ